MCRFHRSFIIGCLIGFLLAWLIIKSGDFRFFLKEFLFCKHLKWNMTKEKEPSKVNELDFQSNFFPNKQRMLCWVVTTPRNKMKAIAVKETWGRKCDTLLFMSSEYDASLPAIELPIDVESRDQLWNKAKLTLRYLYNQHLNDHDWFFKADDDTYVIVENLKEYLSNMNRADALFIGHEFGAGNGSFLSGGAGYVLSRETLRRLVEIGFEQNVCPTYFRGEEDDVTITQCIHKLGVTVPNTSDALNHHRFLSCDVEQFYEGKVGPVHCHPHKKPPNCLSKRPITFHYVSGKRMLMYEYLLYQVKIAEQDVN